MSCFIQRSPNRIRADCHHPKSRLPARPAEARLTQGSSAVLLELLRSMG